ncbi:hypothetical protein AL036_02705 [Salipiger aestuarii]|uniref:Uncharacterized protein n=1 Tax=Salipiger aestuarii TaxID=568098 RepID=A0A327YPM5_9RHOB|nr:hypothetical protein [Salipiger aestuarii]EIE49123.1 hypothetical protein C357_19960 [Citreicella sp. 357]KAA8609656.1 hypothetical protein AL036_02705 [Salipiger aestuarii]KAA8612936.1 hypothetical protein AL037_06320 [Salipiger aestuarii]KAB2543715.1 hypothetical protein AL035_00660 [Salipiger aestuarii]RAK22958.1 hypothetical protein ATI53_1002137 [Salipiger aestuarii]
MALADHPTLHPVNWLRDIRAHVPRKAARDWWNRVVYGPDAPRSDECVYVDPNAIAQHAAAPRPRRRRRHSGMVLGGDWDRQIAPVGADRKYVSCRMHFVDGVAWEDTPLFEKLLREIEGGHSPDGCATRADLVHRYETLDRLFDETRARGRLLAKSELPDYFRREHGGVFVHIARDGTALRAGGGAHRLAIARILELPEMPAQIGVVHPLAIANGALARLRRSRFG